MHLIIRFNNLSNNLSSINRASLVAQTVENPPAMLDTWVWSLGWEDPLEAGMTTHSNILAWRIPWTEQPGGLQSTGSQTVRHNWSDFECTIFWISSKVFLSSISWILWLILFLHGQEDQSHSYVSSYGIFL